MIEFATEIPRRTLPKPTSNLAKLGLSYERKLVKALDESAPPGISIVHNPWLEYRRTGDELKTCCPDIIIVDEAEGYAMVVEVKLNWTPLALQKLRDLYVPVLNHVGRKFNYKNKPLVIVKNLTPDSPRPQSRLTWAFNAETPLFHWSGLGS